MKSLLVLVVLALATTVTEAGFSFPTITGRTSGTSSTPTTSSTSSTPTTSSTSGAVGSGGGMSTLVANLNANAESASLPSLNQVRATLTPAPDTPLSPLVWDSSLAKGANRWAQRCYVNDYSDDYYAGKVGETYFTKPLVNSADLNFITGITSWASQNVTFSLSQNNCFPGMDCSQFRQLAWAKSKKVGCAVNVCGSTLLAVCQFYPPGDFDGLAPYVSSAPVDTITKVDIATGEASVAPLGDQSSLRKRGPSTCTAEGKSGKCVPKSSCTSGNGATAAYAGGTLCPGYLLSNTVCCVYKDSLPVTAAPTNAPTNAPTVKPTNAPTVKPTNAPTVKPTNAPTSAAPTGAPAPTSAAPTDAPSPTSAPTDAPTPTNAPTPTSAPAPKLTFPTSKDWRDASGAVTPVKNQQQCGSCWAFAATAVAESQVSIFTGGSVVDLSEQQVLSCSNSRDSCNGGYPPDALSYAVNTGLIADARSTYTAKDSSCTYSSPSDWQFQNTGTVSNNKDALISALTTYGPILVTVYADNAWQSYRGGVISNSTYTSTNHAVTLVGYDGGSDAWIIKNSWGSGWGEKGFIRIATTGDFAMTKSRSYFLQKTQ